jgi:hypothetical protein
MKNLFFFLLAFASAYTAPLLSQFEEDVEVPQGLKYTGKLIKAHVWSDKAGTHYLIRSQTAEAKPTFLFTAFLEKNGTFTQEFQAKDFPKSKTGAVVFIENLYNISDLDADGLDEVFFAYVCTDKPIPENGSMPNATNYDYKLLLFSKGKKYAVRALDKRLNLAAALDLNANAEPTFDEAFNTAPAFFKGFASLLWDNKNITDLQTIEYAYTFRFKIGDSYLVQEELLMASGGTSYKLLNAQGQPAKGNDDLANMIDFEQSADKKSLLYLNPNGVNVFNSNTQTSNKLLDLSAQNLGWDNFSPFAWSPKKTKLAFATRDGVHILTLTTDWKVKNKEFIADNIYAIASASTMVMSVAFTNENTIQYEVFPENSDQSDAEPVSKTVRIK